MKLVLVIYFLLAIYTALAEDCCLCDDCEAPQDVQVLGIQCSRIEEELLLIDDDKVRCHHAVQAYRDSCCTPRVIEEEELLVEQTWYEYFVSFLGVQVGREGSEDATWTQSIQRRLQWNRSWSSYSGFSFIRGTPSNSNTRPFAPGPSTPIVPPPAPPPPAVNRPTNLFFSGFRPWSGSNNYNNPYYTYRPPAAASKPPPPPPPPPPTPRPTPRPIPTFFNQGSSPSTPYRAPNTGNGQPSFYYEPGPYSGQQTIVVNGAVMCNGVCRGRNIGGCPETAFVVQGGQTYNCQGLDAYMRTLPGSHQNCFNFQAQFQNYAECACGYVSRTSDCSTGGNVMGAWCIKGSGNC